MLKSVVLSLLLRLGPAGVAAEETCEVPAEPEAADASSLGLECPALPRLGPGSNPVDLIFIGDVHGAAEGLRDILVGAGVVDGTTPTKTNFCRRSQTRRDTIVVQVGDLVDRGRSPERAWDCLDQLQASSDPGTVIRLAGNHELSWLTGRYHGSRDSQETQMALTTRIRDDILSGAVVGAVSMLDGALLVTHAGVRPTAMPLVFPDTPDDAASSSREGEGEGQEEDRSCTVQSMAARISSALVEAVQGCAPTTGHAALRRPFDCPYLRAPLFAAGPERKGKGIGGPFWTDFSIISKIASASSPPPLPSRSSSCAALLGQTVQIVGHTPARCDVADSLACQPIRPAPQAVGVDGGMFWGNRAYLQVLVTPSSSSFLSHTKLPDGLWLARNLTRGPSCLTALPAATSTPVDPTETTQDMHTSTATS